MQIPSIEKSVNDDRDATWDWSQFPELAVGSGLTIASGTVTCTDNTITIGNGGVATVSGTKTQIEISGGTLNKVYATIWTITLSNGRKIVRQVNYSVVE